MLDNISDEGEESEKYIRNPPYICIRAAQKKLGNKKLQR